MKVKIYYTLTYEAEAEINDRFQMLLNDTSKPSKKNRLRLELMKEANNYIPMEGTLSEVWEDKKFGKLLVGSVPYSGPTAP